MCVVKPYYAAALLLALFSCQSAYKEKHDTASIADSTTAGALQTEPVASAATPLQSPARKMLRTASISARVDNLQDFTKRVEDLTNRMNGMVLQSELHNEVQETSSYGYHTDSLRKVTVYRPVAHLELRVPAVILDSVVRCIGNWAQFVENREIKQEDVTLTMLSNKMRVEATGRSLNKPLPTTSRNAVALTTYNDNKEAENIDRKIENLSLDDRVAVASLSVDLYQRPQAGVEIVVDPAAVTRAAFGTELFQSIRQGGVLLREVLLGLISTWPLWLLLAAGFLLYRKRGLLWK